MPEFWYALRSHPHKEDLLWRQLVSREVKGYYPCIPVTPVNPRARKIRPYFPGYMFVKVDLEAMGISMFQYMPYATGLVSFGGEPAVVSEVLIQALKQKVADIRAAGGEIFQDIHSGDAISIQGGPFAGYEAIFDVRLRGSERVRVLMKMLEGRVVPLEVNAGQIEKLHSHKDSPQH